MRTVLLSVAVLAAACGSEKKADPAPAPTPAKLDPADKPPVVDVEPTAVEPDPGGTEPTVEPPVKPAKPTAQIDLTLSGAVVATIKGTGGTCVCDADHAGYTLRSQDFNVQPSFSLTVLVTSPAEWMNPGIILNVSAPQRGSFGRNLTKHRAEDKLSVAKDCSGVTLDDVLLRGMMQTKGDVTIKGTIHCGA
jgi:hypothetical protein